MERQEIDCPYCGHKINNTDERCSNCGELFVEPDLSEFRLVSIPLFLACETILSVAGLPFLYSMIWLIINCKNILKIAIPKDAKKFSILFGLFCVLVVLTMAEKMLIAADIIVEILLIYRVLRIIEKFTLKKYNSPVTHHELGMIFFRTLYVVYYLDTYSGRVKNPNDRYFLDTEKWFKYSVILLVIIVFLCLVGISSVPFLKF